MRVFGGVSMIALALLAGGGEALARPGPAIPRQADETIAYTKRKSPSLSAGYNQATMQQYNTTPGLTGVVGALIAGYMLEKMVGGHITRANELVDPGPELGHRVAIALAEQRGAVVREPALETKAVRPKTLAREAAGARYLVDVRTTNWFAAPGGSSKTSYPSQYSAALTVIAVESAVAVVSTSCGWSSPVLRTSDGDAISGEKKPMLQAQFAAASDACFEQFMTAVQGAIPPGARRDVAWASERPPPPVDPEMAAASGATSRMIVQAPPRRWAGEGEARDDAWADQRQADTRVFAEAPPPRYGPLPPQVRQAEIRDYAWAEQQQAETYREESGSSPPPAPERVEYRSAGRDASGFLVWPGKRP